jgi:chemotaxis protein CheX
MKMNLIQPFVNSVDSVVAEIMGCQAQISEVTMTDSKCQDGVAALVTFSGGIEGRAILSMDRSAVQQAANFLLGAAADAQEETAREVVCEISNMIVGNAVTQLNDSGFRFRVLPPEICASSEGLKSSQDIETLVLQFETPHGNVLLNIAMRYTLRRAEDAASLTAV